ncbi:MAG: ABC transporter ATP-binding protein [Pseudomonadota bacterium]
MNDLLLQVKDLQTWFETESGTARVVDGVSFAIRRGETFALLGESGCGKSMTSLSLMRLVPGPAGRIVSGEVLLNGQDLLKLPEPQMRAMRGKRIAMIFQEPMTSLNPVMTVGAQIQESVERHLKLKGAAARERVYALLDAVGIPSPRQRYDEYPHQLSGGMKQRVMISIALAGEPDLLIADEPTTALDVTIQAQVLELMQSLQKQTGMAIMLITHDLGVVHEVADRVAVMYAGQIVEQAARAEFFQHPQHPYSRKLFASLPDMNKRARSLAVIHGNVPPLTTEFTGCRFAERCDYAWELCRTTVPQWSTTERGGGVRCHLADPQYRSQAPAPKSESMPLEAAPVERADQRTMLKVADLKVHFPIQQGLFKREVGRVHAVDGVDIELKAGQTLALVGESGCGKTTVGKGILQLIRPTGGEVRFDDLELTQLSNRELRIHRGDIQIIFQDPFSSLNPRMRVADIIEEGMVAQRKGGDAPSRQRRIDELLQQVGLRPEHKHRYPHEFSGGQRQRICIARALAVEPKLIICDEPTSALDVSVQAQILNLLKRLQQELGLAYLFITHNISVVEYLAHDVAVMYLGRIVEQGKVEEVIRHPKHPYTQALLSAVPSITEKPVEKQKLAGELPSPINPPSGCHFHPRCPKAMPQCRVTYPGVTTFTESHQTRCYLYAEKAEAV